MSSIVCICLIILHITFGLFCYVQFAVVKKLNSSINRVSDEDFLDFVWKVSHLRHPSIIRLLGYCMAHGERLLVYEFVGNGTLYESLHSDLGGNTKLPWKIRVKIALGVAKALELSIFCICFYIIRRVSCLFQISHIA